MSIAIRLARPEDADAFVEHVLLHVGESGSEGSPHFALSRRLAREEVRDGALTRWRKRLSEPLWGRTWLLWTPRPEGERPRPFGLRWGGSERVVGHVDLRGGRIPAELHRATLGMGLQRAFTRQGHGRRLLEAAIAWARDEAGLSWIDLGVFSTNEPARKLYTRMGFVEVGVHADAFRIDAGISVDDIQMTLALR